MSVDERSRPPARTGRLWRLAKGLFGALGPTERSILTREGVVYFLVSLTLLVAGLIQQVNLILLVFTLAAGPFMASIFGGRSMLRRLSVMRRVPAYVFAGDPLIIDYGLENGRRWYPALALFLEDALVPVDRAVSGASDLTPRVFFPRVAGRDRARLQWQCPGPRRGRYRFRDLDVGTRSPFGIVEHRVTISLPDSIVVYPKIGQLTRRWFLIQRLATENRRGQRHDRSAQQVEYHGLRDYRSGDSPRWIHWRTSARRGELMVKEFEQQNEQDLAVLVDPWLPRSKAAAEQREALEQAVSFAATVCLETCRHQGRRLVLGWTGPAPGVRHGPASVKLLHELLEQLAALRPASEGGLAELLDILPPAVLREAVMVIVSTRPLNLLEEAERSSRLSGTAARSLQGRVMLLNATAGELAPLFEPAESSTRNLLAHRLSSAIQDRLSAHKPRHRDARSDGDTDGDLDGHAARDGDGQAPRSTHDGEPSP
jgi:uncharacterized protein (DUF58 family)